MAKVAFELREDAADFSGGTVSLPTGEAFDVAKALNDGGGKVVLNPDPGKNKDGEIREGEAERAAADADLIEALSRFPALKRTSATSNSTSKGDRS